jgi:hypothetical protein
MTDTLNKNPESRTGYPTPETDKCVKENKHLRFLEEDHSSINGNFTLTNPVVNLCKKLERERDESINACHIWQSGHSALVRERDEALWDCNRWSSRADAYQQSYEQMLRRIDVVASDRDGWKQLAVEQEIELKDAWIEIERWRDLCTGWKEEAINAIKDPRE